VSCQGVQALGSSCAGDDECRARGLPRGVCAEGTCATACAGASECPAGFACVQPPEGAGVCQRQG
jgi:hypothetical protein